MINLVIQSFGREHEYRRAVLTILSFYAHVSKPLPETRVILFTDRPDYLEPFLTGLPVHYRLLTSDKIRAMRGEIDFLHRMKIAVIEESFSIAGGNLLYVDSDTFFIADPAPKMALLSDQASFMHLREYSFDTLREAVLPAGESFLAVYSLITNQSFRLADGSPVSITPAQYSWNAGVMFLHHSVAGLVSDVYALTDQLYPATQNHASEQYAFSVILQNRMTLNACDDVVYHYWYRIKKHIIDAFLIKRLTLSWSVLPLNTKLEEVRRWTSSFPRYLDEHVFTLRDDAVQYFNTDEFGKGFRAALRAFFKDPFSVTFIKDVLYHTRRFTCRKK